MKRIISLLLALALTAGALTGCQSGGSDQTTAAAVSQEETASAGSREQTASQAETEASGTEDLNETKELVLGSVRDMIPGEGDAFYVNLSAGVWEPLIYNNNHELQPGLAKSWSYNEDCTEWTFVLRDDAVFTDGVKFNADVCIQNIERYKAGPLTST